VRSKALEPSLEFVICALFLRLPRGTGVLGKTIIRLGRFLCLNLSAAM
jgi:hypothetical protein